MSSSLLSLTVGPDHAVPLELQQNQTATVTVAASGGTVYYADKSYVTASSNQGSIVPSGSSVFTANVWLFSPSYTAVSVLFQDVATSAGGSGVITGINQPGTALIQGQIVSPTPLLASKTVAVDPTRTTATNAAAALTISTPDASGQTTEPAVIRVPGGWHGHEYWAVITPYTNGAGSTENPCLYYSDDGQTFTPQPGVPFPIVGQPTGQGANSHNDDPDIVYGPDGKLHLFWLAYLQTPNTTVIYWCTYDGTTLTSPTVLWTTVNTTEAAIAPIFMWDGANNQWVCWYTDTANFYNSVNAVYPYKRRTCAGVSPSGTWSAGAATAISGGPASKSIWETHIARCGEQVHIVATFCDIMTGGGNTSLYFGVSNDSGLTWTFNTSALLTASAAGWDRGVMYRATIVPLDDGSDGLYEMWYSGAVSVVSSWGMGYTKIYLAPSATQLAVLVPNTVQVNCLTALLDASGVTGTWALGLQTASLFNGYIANSGTNAQNDAIAFNVTLASGTYNFALMYAKGGTLAIATVQIDGVTVGTIDTYNAATVYNNSSKITGIVVPTSGQHTVVLKAATRNASSTGWLLTLNAFQFRKTA